MLPNDLGVYLHDTPHRDLLRPRRPPRRARAACGSRMRSGSAAGCSAARCRGRTARPSSASTCPSRCRSTSPISPPCRPRDGVVFQRDAYRRDPRPQAAASAPRRAARARRAAPAPSRARRGRAAAARPAPPPSAPSASEPPSRWSAGASFDSAPIVRLRLAPSMIGQPSPCSKARPFISWRLCWTRLAEAEAGIDDDPLARDPRRHRRRDPLLQPVIDFEQHRPVVARIVLHRLGRALMVHQHDRAAGLGDHLGRARIPGQRRDVVDHAPRRRRAPPPSPPPCACRSRPPCRPRRAARPPAAPAPSRRLPRPASRRAGSIRRRRRSIAAPAAAMSCPAAIAASASAKRPPSEKLSGVTLRMPTTCGWSSRITRSPSVQRRRAARSSFAQTARLGLAEPRLDPLDRHQLGAVRRRTISTAENQLQPAGQPRDLAVMPERRVDEAGRAEIELCSAIDAALGSAVRREIVAAASASSGTSAPPSSTCQKVQPLHAGAPCTRGADLVDRALLARHARPRRRRSTRALQRRLRVGQHRARRDHAALDQRAERHLGLGRARGHHPHRAFVERQRRIDPLARDLRHSGSRARSRSSAGPSRRATAPVVPVPKKGSSTTSPLLVQASSTR